jgi:hypothetical protein
LCSHFLYPEYSSCLVCSSEEVTPNSPGLRTAPLVGGHVPIN